MDVSELVVRLKVELNLQGPRAQDDFRIFFLSAYNHYDDLLVSYVRRNISFLLDSLYITLSHSVDPLKNPTGFGLALGSFIGLLEKLKYPEVVKALFSDQQSVKFFKNCIKTFKSAKSFNFDLLSPFLEEINTILLEGEELKNYSDSLN